MSFEAAFRLTEILLSLALIQQSLEHMARYPVERIVFALRAFFCLLLISGLDRDVTVWALLGLSLVILHRFQGAYNGGSDRMSLLILSCLALAHLAPDRKWEELALAYLALQLCLSYFVSGWVKLRNPDWRSGEALADVFRFSAYPVSEALRGWAERPVVLFWAGWAVILFETAFPLALIDPRLLVGALVIAALFHFSNACLFGLNRFFWTWLSAYPSILWLQARLFGQAGFSAAVT